MEHFVMDFDPAIFRIGSIEIRWYGLMYVIGFLIAGFVGTKLAKEKFFKVDPKKVDNLITYLLIGMFIGARTFYVFIYNFDFYLNNPLDILAVWKGGLSFHGALVGILLAAFIFSKQYKVSYLSTFDSMAIMGTPGLFFGRIGNFINGELYGKITSFWGGVIFKDGGPLPRHPSQLYEGIFEGLVLFFIFYFFRKKVKYHGVIASLFLIGYGVVRYAIEFVREPDPQLGYYFAGTTTMGQILCFFMIVSGFSLLFYSRKKKVLVS